MWKYRISFKGRNGKYGVCNLVSKKIISKRQMFIFLNRIFKDYEGITELFYVFEKPKKEYRKRKTLSGGIGKYPIKKAYTYKKGIYA